MNQARFSFVPTAAPNREILGKVAEMGPKCLGKVAESGKDYERHNALNNIMSNPDYGIRKAYVLCNDNLHKAGNVEYVPVYMVMFIQKNPGAGELIYKVDLSGIQNLESGA